ncbi:MAG: hypothetical protein ACR2JY_18410, partial [Chloroflexota bacterium]
GMSQSLATFIEARQAAIVAAVRQTYPPRYDALVRDACGLDTAALLRPPLGAQADAIRALVLALREGPSAQLVAEMGSGKTLMACAAAHLGGFRRTLVVCPPHLVDKWRREVLATVPGAKAAVVRTVGDLERARRLTPPSYVVLSREQAKLGARWRAAASERPWRGDDLILRRLACPACGVLLADEQGVPLTPANLAAKKRRCLSCREPLWQVDNRGPRRVALAEYVRDRLRGHFDLLVVDECHEMKARGSAQGVAAATLAEVCGKTLTLSGTLFGGYASSLFHLLWRFSPPVRAEFGYGEEQQWVQRYGIVERVSKRDPDAYGEDGRQSRRRGYLVRTVEKPGVAPGVLAHLLGNTVFLRLGDVARELPPYSERVVRVPLDRDHDDGPDAPSQANAYRRLADDLRRAVMGALAGGSKRLLGAYLQALLAYPDGCTREETVLDPASAEVIAHAPALPTHRRYPKERLLVELLRRERQRGRRTLVFVTHTETRDLTPRLVEIIAESGLRAAVLKANTVAPAAREGWVEARVQEGIDTLICHPRLVQTGLDLLAFPSIVWLQPDYSVYTLRQASRRSWRIGSRFPVEVSFLVYDGTLQAEALALVAAKLRAALLIEGELPDDGLGELAGAGEDVFLALARRLAGQEESNGASLEALFTEARATEQDGAVPLIAAGDAAPGVSDAPRATGSPPSRSATEVAPPQPLAEVLTRVNPRRRPRLPNALQPSLFDV